MRMAMFPEAKENGYLTRTAPEKKFQSSFPGRKCDKVNVKLSLGLTKYHAMKRYPVLN
jgi:hypothetical protein